MIVFVNAHDSDIIDMKSFVKLPNRLHPLYSNKEKKSFFFYPISALIGIKVLQGHYNGPLGIEHDVPSTL